MVEHRPCDCDGLADDGLGHFLKVIMIAIIILVPGVNLTRSSPQEFHNPDCTILGMMIKSYRLVICYDQNGHQAPALSPQMATSSGFPPRCAMLSRTHCRAST